MSLSLSFSDATHLLKKGNSLHIVGQEIRKETFGRKVRHFFSPQKKLNEVKKVIQFVEAEFERQADPERALLDLGNELIKKYQNRKKLKTDINHLDRILSVVKKRFGQEQSYLTKDNNQLLKKWREYGFEENIFHQHPEFVQFLFDSTLASQMKVTHDAIQEIEGEACILVEGRWTPFTELKENFSFKYDRYYNETFVFHKQTNQIYTYLDLGRGLEEFHPYSHGFNKPISHLTQEEYQRTLDKAKEFVRTSLEQNPVEERTHIFQIVSSAIKTDTNNPIIGNYRKLFVKPQHPYVRMINSDGDVFETGYLLGRKLAKPLETAKGKFRSIDTWEYKQAEERIVTNIAITKEEFDKAQDYVNSYLHSREGPAFNYMHQNCTVFTRYLAKATFGLDIPTEMPFSKIVRAAFPEFLKKMGRCFENTGKAIGRPIVRITPQCIKKGISNLIKLVRKVTGAISAFFLSLINLMFGGINGTRGRKFTPDMKKREKMSPPLLSLRNWFNLKRYNINFIYPLQEWQKKQASTVVYKNQRKLAIAPNL